MDLLPKKRLGQHWLTDRPSLQSIVDSAQLKSTDTVLEVGPGLGSLTKILASRAKQVVAVELDKELARQLSKEVAAANLEVVAGDIRRFNLSLMPGGYKVVANIPYYLTSYLLQFLSSAANPPSLMVLLVQKEVAQRISASPGQMSILGVSVQLHYEPQLGPVILAKMFSPPPKVDSQVVILQRRPKPLFKDLDEAKFLQVVKAGFSNRRKKLRSSLSGGLRISKDEADYMLEQADINGELRAEALNLQQWHRLYLQFLLKNDLRSLLHS